MYPPLEEQLFVRLQIFDGIVSTLVLKELNETSCKNFTAPPVKLKVSALAACQSLTPLSSPIESPPPPDICPM